MMLPGEAVVLRESNEPALVLAVLDAAGRILVRVADEEFEVHRDELMLPEERHASCGCCG